MAIPASIQNMIRRHKHPISPIRPAKLAPGQLRVVALETDVGILRRTVLVIKTNSENGTSVIMMTHPYVELATDVDVVIPSSVRQLPYGLVVQTDCVGIMWTSDLSSTDGEFFGELEEVAFRQVRYLTSDSEHSKHEDFVNAGLQTGLELKGPIDTRWGFKRAEGDLTRSFTQNCLSTILYESDNKTEIIKQIEELQKELSESMNPQTTRLGESLESLVGNFPGDASNIMNSIQEIMLQKET